MGLLDDAIKEHLDLKRRRGADPSEVERAEREALGPVRRKGESPAVAEADDEQPLAAGPAYDQAAEGGEWTYADGDEPPQDVADEERELPPLEFSGDEADLPRSPPAGPERPFDEPAFDEPAFAESAFEEPAFDDEPPPPAQPPRFARGAVGAETSEYDVEEAMATDDEDASDDMLEETPEFLQDTPDHDRLWFEQRPPKDFDFDG